MTTQFNPDGTVPISVKGWQRVSVSLSTNTAPIVIWGPSPGGHGFNNGDTVGIEGHTINTAANGLWVITVLSTLAFSLNGSTGNGAGTTTGYALDYSVTPQLTLPSDGDLEDATSVNVPLEATADTIPYIYKRAGKYNLYNLYTIATSDADWTTGPHVWLSGTQPGNALWNDIGSITYDPAALTPDVVQALDFLVITFTSTVKITAGAFPVVPFSLGVVFSNINAPPAAATYVPGSAITISNVSGDVYAVSMKASYLVTVASGFANKRVDFSLMVFGNVASPDTYAWTGDRQIVMEHWRLNA
jgi:hypothetical protein